MLPCRLYADRAYLYTLLIQSRNKHDQGIPRCRKDLLHDDGFIFDSLDDGLVQSCQGAQGCYGAAGVCHLGGPLTQCQLTCINEQWPCADVSLQQKQDSTVGKDCLCTMPSL